MTLYLKQIRIEKMFNNWQLTNLFVVSIVSYFATGDFKKSRAEYNRECPKLFELNYKGGDAFIQSTQKALVR